MNFWDFQDKKTRPKKKERVKEPEPVEPEVEVSEPMTVEESTSTTVIQKFFMALGKRR